jgi:5-methylcytosine-specific restriction endonuclease McrA
LLTVHKFNDSYDYLGTMSKQEAVEMIYKGKVVSIVDTDEVWRSPSTVIAIPFAVKLNRLTKSKRGGNISLNRDNILRRDNHICQYDDCKETKNLSVDHVIPQSYYKNGKAAKVNPHNHRCRSWENLVAACYKCNNLKKKNRTPEEAKMKLKKIPRKPVLNDWIDVFDLWQEIAARQNKMSAS